MQQFIRVKYWLLLLFLGIGLCSFGQDSINVNKAISQLHLERSMCKMDLVVFKICPNNPLETILVIPEIVNEDEHYFELNSHVLIIDTQSGKIKYKYFESYKTNNWYSDAIRLMEISIDTAPYNITNHSRAFGVRVRYVGSSHANPYESEQLSLFVLEKNVLKQILKDFTVKEYNGEWDTNCTGEFSEQKSTLIISNNVTSNHFDILIKTTRSNAIAFIGANNECDEKETITRSTQVLKYENGKYR